MDSSPVVLYEIRVHGVHGTPPASVLEVPQVIEVAGDRRAGFYRQQDPDGSATPPEAGQVREAYSWSGLTSGGKLRALWLLLLPFMLANIAFFTAAAPLGVDPARFPVDGKPWRATRRTLEAVLRLFSLSLTAFSVWAAVITAMDLVGWQAARIPSGDRPAWLGFLEWAWIDRPNREYLVTGLVPLALILLFWFLANTTWQSLERSGMPAAPAEAGAVLTPLEDRRMWNGQRPVRRLRSVHVSVALATLAAAVLLPLWSAGRPAVASVTTALAGYALVNVVLVCLPRMTDRRLPEDDTPDRRWDWFTFSPWIGAALLLAGAILVALGPAWRAAWPDGTRGALPGITTSLRVGFGLQLVLLLAVAVLAAFLRWFAARETCSARTGGEEGSSPIVTKPAWLGLTPAVFALLGWLLLAGWAAGSAFVVARYVGSTTITPGDGPPDAVVVPPSYWWAAAVAVAAIAGLLPVGVRCGILLASGSRLVTTVEACYRESGSAGGENSEARFRAIARAWRRATIATTLRGWMGCWALFVAVVVLIAAIADWRHATWLEKDARPVVTLGVLLLVAIAAWLVRLGFRVYSDPGTRRLVGVLWDLGTFWPRAVHPLSPPCYMERTLPDLLTRLAEPPAASAPRTVLSCHSQGTVIGAVALMQTKADRSRSISFVTYGSPLRTLYSVYFPAYFGVTALTRLGQFVRSDGWSKATELSSAPAERSTWRWRNLYRSTDPIGGPVFADHTGDTKAREDVDWWLIDPVLAKRVGDTAWPPVEAHGSYPSDPAYPRAVRAVTTSERG